MTNIVTVVTGSYLFIVGCCLASFANVLVYRIPRNLDFVKGRSFCPRCQHQLKAADLVPLFSWLFLKGKCRYCGGKISARYFLVELWGGCLFLLCYAHYQLSVQAVLAFAFLLTLTVISLIDADTMEIPDGLLWTVLILVVIYWLLIRPQSLVASSIGAAIVSVPMLLLTYVIPDCFGGADIRLIGIAGFLLGWKRTLLAAFLALLAGGIYGGWLLLSHKADKKAHFAFGPCLSLGIALALFWGNELIAWYLSLFY